ncbi:uncharacterized protein LOC112566929 [Pomacea canaliculata]|uniref:uncharacterized protein LOC112566929 n=1 Tax=Pomacea canaliculata TaxID=400727 RepID=UPI000D72F02B|nr:uncharacterized protein LOC112566929 [Pomacea canaliculata]
MDSQEPAKKWKDKGDLKNIKINFIAECNCSCLLLQTEREQPPLPERVFYKNFEDIKKDLNKIQAPWIIKVNTPANVQIGVSSETEYVWKIIVELRAENNTQAYVKVLGVPAPRLTTDLESKRLSTFLQELQVMSICTGVTESSLQEYAALPDGQTQFYRHIQYTTVNDVVCHISSVRSVQCWLLLPSNSSTYCMVCHQIEHALLEKKKRKESRILQPVKPNDPLHCLDIDQLKTLFKEERKEKIRLEKAASN